MRYQAPLIVVLLLLLTGGSQDPFGVAAQTRGLAELTGGLSAEVAFPVSLAVGAATSSGCEPYRYLSNDEGDKWLPLERTGLIAERAYLNIINPSTYTDSCFGHKGRISMSFLLCTNQSIAERVAASLRRDLLRDEGTKELRAIDRGFAIADRYTSTIVLKRGSLLILIVSDPSPADMIVVDGIVETISESL